MTKKKSDQEEDNVSSWMPIWIGKYMADTMNFTTLQHGAYFLLLMAMWKGKGVLSADDEDLASTAKLSPEQWAGMKAKILAKFEIDGATMTQSRLATERERAQHVSEVRKAAGAQGAKLRWERRKAAEKDSKDSKAVAGDMANRMGSGGEGAFTPGENYETAQKDSKNSKPEANGVANPMANGSQSGTHPQHTTPTNVGDLSPPMAGGGEGAQPPPAPPPRKSGSSWDGTKAKGTVRKLHDYPPEFLETWEIYPDRSGTNSKQDAFTAWGARISEARKDGVSTTAVIAAMHAGTQRYLRWAIAAGKVGTQYVMAGERFFGRAKHYLERHNPPAAAATPTNTHARRSADSDAYDRIGEEDARDDRTVDVPSRIVG